MITQWISDFRHAWRALLRTPGFLVTSVTTLALAIGVVVGMFSVVNTVLLRPLPFPDADRLVVLAGIAPGSDLPERFGLGQEFYLHYRDRSKLLDGIFMFGAGTSTLRTENRVERIPMACPTNGIYATLGARPQVGRLPTPEDEDRVVLISDQLWSSWFGRDPAVVGKTYFISGEMREVIGVMPPEFSFPSDGTLLWVAGDVRPADVRPGQLGAPVVARMKPGVTRGELAVELTRLSKELPARFGGTPNYARLIDKHTALVDPLLERLVRPTARTSLWVLLGAVSVVLLIACANVANLFMVRAEGRRRDLAVRRAIGASRAQLVRLQLAEAFLVALPAGILAVILTALTLPLFLRAAPEGIPRLALAGLDLSTLTAAFALVVLVALACGTAPALHASSPDLSPSSRGVPREHRRPPPGTGCARRGANGARAGVAHRLRAAGAEPPEAAQRRSRLRHRRHLHLPVRARTEAPHRRSELGTAPPGFHGPPARPSRRNGRGSRQQHSARRRDRHGAVPHQDDGPGRRRGAARSELRRRRLLSRDGDRPAAGPAVHERRGGDAEQQRHHQPVGGRAALVRSRSRRAADPSSGWRGSVVHRCRPGGGREAERLAGRRRGDRLLPADRDRRRPRGRWGRRLTSSSRRALRASAAKCAILCGRWRQRHRCIASSRWSSWRSGRWCSCRSRC